MSGKKPSSRTLFNQAIQGDRLAVIGTFISALTLPFVWWLGIVGIFFSLLWISWTYKDWKKLDENNQKFGQFIKEVFYDDHPYDLIPNEIGINNAIYPSEAVENTRKFAFDTHEDGNGLQPNIVFIRATRELTAFSDIRNCWEDSVIGEPSLIIKFGNEPLGDRKIGELKSVNAQIDYYNKRGKLLHTVDRGIWLDERASVWFHFSTRQRLLIVQRSPNGRIWIAEDRNLNRKSLDDNFIKIRVRLIGDNQWVKDFNFILTVDKKGVCTIEKID